MGKSKSPKLPEPPSFQANQYVNPNIGFLSSAGQSLARGGFMPGGGASLPAGFEKIDLSFLEPLVSLNPEATRTAVDLASRDVVRYRDRAQQDIINQLEASNQLTSSAAVNRLSDLNEQFSGDIADIATQFYLADVERSLANTYNLFGLGISTTGSAAQLGLSEQSQRNQFALENYQNQVLKALAEQPQQRGGFTGALMGAAGGGLQGFAMGGPLGAAIGAGLGGTAGYFSSGAETGASIFSTGAGAYGLSRFGPNSRGTYQLPDLSTPSYYYQPFNSQSMGLSQTDPFNPLNNPYSRFSVPR